MDESLTFTIEGDEYDQVQTFREEHAGCLGKHPNATGAQFEYAFCEDGIGICTTVTCVCGDRLILPGDYNLSGHVPFQVIPDDDKTLKLVRWLLIFRSRPGMVTEKSYKLLHALLMGRVMDQPRDCMFPEMIHKTDLRFEKKCEGHEYSDEEQYSLYFDCFEEVLREEYPEFVKENSIFKNTAQLEKYRERIRREDTYLFQPVEASDTKPKTVDVPEVKTNVNNEDARITEVGLWFENCESVTFSIDEIEHMKLSGIKTEIYTCAINRSSRNQIANFVEIQFKSKANKPIVSLGRDPFWAFERLKGNDITHITIFYSNGFSETVLPTWQGIGWHNDAQGWHWHPDGSMTVYVVKGKKKRHKFCLKNGYEYREIEEEE